MTAIYARQSIDKKDSISIETQIAACRRVIPDGANTRVFTDKGFSGKNTDRPEFRRMMSEIKQGRIEKILVYKLDRISRSLNDFSNMMEVFRQYGVEFASTVETFDTSTPIGRAMLGIIMVFAELERENILLRVKDNYYARGEKGMFLGGPAIYGFSRQTASAGGVKTSVLVSDKSAQVVEYIFNTYSAGEASLGDIAKRLNEREIPSPNGAQWDTSKVSRLLRSPTYVRADAKVYRYFKDKGAGISNPVEDFTGERGCFLYGKRSANERKYTDVHGHILSLGLHEGIIPPQIWLDAQARLDGNFQIANKNSGGYSWLTGLIKCGRCGYALRVMQKRFFYCSGKANRGACAGFSEKPYIGEVEEAVKRELFKKFAELSEADTPGERPPADPKANRLRIELEKIDVRADNLIERLAETSAAVGKALEEKLEALLIQRAQIEKELKKAAPVSKPEISFSKALTALYEFDDMPIETRRRIAGLFIKKVLLRERDIEIIWRF